MPLLLVLQCGTCAPLFIPPLSFLPQTRTCSPYFSLSSSVFFGLVYPLPATFIVYSRLLAIFFFVQQCTTGETFLFPLHSRTWFRLPPVHRNRVFFSLSIPLPTTHSAPVPSSFFSFSPPKGFSLRSPLCVYFFPHFPSCWYLLFFLPLLFTQSLEVLLFREGPLFPERCSFSLIGLRQLA